MNTYGSNNQLEVLNKSFRALRRDVTKWTQRALSAEDKSALEKARLKRERKHKRNVDERR